MSLRPIAASIVLSVFSAIAFACTPSNSATGAPAVSATPMARAASAPSPARSASPASSTCPAPKASEEACAAVMTYVKIGGVCCAYADPCSAPDGPHYANDKCTDPMK